jgi:hypothetical protein
LSFVDCFAQAQQLKQSRKCGVDYSKAIPPRTGADWVRDFVNRHPVLKTAKGKVLELARQRAWNRENVEPHFKLFFLSFLFSIFYFHSFEEFGKLLITTVFLLI